MQIYKALYISPMIPSYDLEGTANFFTGLFGFSTLFAYSEYAILYKDKLSIHLLRAGVDIGEMEFYLEVDNVDSLWAAISENLGDIKVRAPFDREYGMREFHIIVPHTKTLMFVGQALLKT